MPSREDLKAVYRPGSLDSVRNEKQYTNTDVFVKVELLHQRDTFVSTPNSAFNNINGDKQTVFPLQTLYSFCQLRKTYLTSIQSYHTLDL